jgi:hypothetical protein
LSNKYFHTKTGAVWFQQRRQQRLQTELNYKAEIFFRPGGTKLFRANKLRAKALGYFHCAHRAIRRERFSYFSAKAARFVKSGAAGNAGR